MSFARRKAVADLVAVVEDWAERVLQEHEEEILRTLTYELPKALRAELFSEPATKLATAERDFIEACAQDYRAQLARSGGMTDDDRAREVVAYRESLTKEIAEGRE